MELVTFFMASLAQFSLAAFTLAAFVAPLAFAAWVLVSSISESWTREELKSAALATAKVGGYTAAATSVTVAMLVAPAAVLGLMALAGVVTQVRQAYLDDAWTASWAPEPGYDAQLVDANMGGLSVAELAVEHYAVLVERYTRDGRAIDFTSMDCVREVKFWLQGLEPEPEPVAVAPTLAQRIFAWLEARHLLAMRDATSTVMQAPESVSALARDAA